MLAGDNNRGVYNASNNADQAISYVCLGTSGHNKAYHISISIFMLRADYDGNHSGDPDWAERPNFFDHQCPDGMRAQVYFPSCWDGVNLDSADHKSHMSYPIGQFNGGVCPSSHPKRLISLFYEYIIPTGDHPYHGAGSWSFSNGDQNGLRFHGMSRHYTVPASN